MTTDEALRAALEAAIATAAGVAPEQLKLDNLGNTQAVITAFRKALDERGLVLTDRANVEAEWHDGYRTGWRDRLFGYQGGLGGNPLRFTKVDGAENMPPQAPAEPQDAREGEGPPMCCAKCDVLLAAVPGRYRYPHSGGDICERCWHALPDEKPTTDRVIDRWLKPPKPDPKADAEKAREERFAKAGEAIARGMG